VSLFTVFGLQALLQWFVSNASPAPTSEVLREYCRTRLAGFKVPLRFHCVAALPCTAAGKVQRHRLREPETGSSR
jgi:fatty-acyl-CoA synthase